jgi:hypothetical protein
MRITLTIFGINGNKALNLGRGQRLLKKAILEALVAVFPDGNSFTRFLLRGREVGTGSFRFVGELDSNY